jgi:asparagine synthase (glutamine-hydrolysing)
MCGIAAIYLLRRDAVVEPSTLTHAAQALADRGPDGHGSVTTPGTGLVHTRLSIIDPTAASDQPLFHADGRYAMVYNGELFNYRDLRRELESEGMTFSTQGDSEVLLKWFVARGPEGLYRCNGFFAFVIHDRHKDELWAGRDRMGEKPLYAGHDARGWYWGSNLRALRALGLTPEWDADALRLYFHLNYIPCPFSVWKNVAKIEPGTVWRYAAGREPKKILWYKLCKASAPLAESDSSSTDGNRSGCPTMSDSAASLRHRMHAAIAARMVSDVPVAAFLSGGIDSSIVCSLATRQNPNIEAFSAGFPGEAMFDESVYARDLAGRLGVKHRIIPLSEVRLLASVNSILNHPDEPYADSSAVALHALCAEIKGQYKVVLSGDGADELFGGYNKHRAEWIAQSAWRVRLMRQVAGMGRLFPHNRHSRWGNLFRKAARLDRGLRLGARDRYWEWCGYGQTGTDVLADKTATARYREMQEICLAELGMTPGLDEVLRNDTRLVLTNDMLYKTDYFGMLNAVEIRSPFLDPGVVDLAMTTPWTQKLNGRQGKLIVREAFRHDVPNEVFQRPKHGFEVPLRRWLLGPLRDRMEALTSANALEATGLIDSEHVERLKARLTSDNPGDAHATLWAIMNFQAFALNF